MKLHIDAKWVYPQLHFTRHDYFYFYGQESFALLSVSASTELYNNSKTMKDRDNAEECALNRTLTLLTNLKLMMSTNISELPQDLYLMSPN